MDLVKTVAVIPCYREVTHIKLVAETASNYVDEVIITDDNSNDGIENISFSPRIKVIRNNNQRGVGSNTLNGIEAVLESATRIVTLDGDGQHNPANIPRLLRDEELIIGKRNFSAMPLYRRVGNEIIRWLFNVGSKTKISDTQSCFRAYSTRMLRTFNIKEAGFAFSIETLVKIRSMKVPIKEVPIDTIYNGKGDHKLWPLRHGMQVAMSIVWWRLRVEGTTTTYKAIKSVVRRVFGARHIPLLSKMSNYIYDKIIVRDKVVVNDYMLQVDNRGGISQMLTTKKQYEPLTTSLIKDCRGKIALDVGANIGYYTLLLAQHFDSVHAFEPEPSNMQLLWENLTINNVHNVSTHQSAVGLMTGIGKLYISKHEPGAHSLIRDRHHDLKEYKWVTVNALDTLFPSEIVDFIKIDTEGNDCRVILGGKELIKRSSVMTLVTELHIAGLYKVGLEPKDFLELLQALGFKSVVMVDENLGKIYKEDILKHVLDSQSIHGQAVNLVCSKKLLEEYCI